MNHKDAMDSLKNFMAYIDTPVGHKKYPELQELVEFAKERGFSADAIATDKSHCGFCRGHGECNDAFCSH